LPGERNIPLVLVVDDDESVRNLVAAALTPRGYRVLGAENGMRGLELALSEAPRVIILDYWMPVLDGAGFMMELRSALTVRPPVILFTAIDDDPKLARDLGVDVYVEKPVDLGRFVKLVDAVVRGAAPAARLLRRREGNERRAYPRRTFRARAWVSAGRAAPKTAFTIDLSEGGVCLELDLAVAPGAYLAITLELPGGQQLEVEARVRYVTSEPAKVGAQFLSLDAARRALLSDLLRQV
jgi:DNA-binding response OmpR family regulator